MLCIPIRPAFVRMGERAWQSEWKWVHCSGRRICGWKCLETTAANRHDFASLSPDGCSQGPQLKDNPVLLTTLYLLDAVVAHHCCVGEIGLFSTLILLLSSIFLSKCTGEILWWIPACWAESQSLNLAAVKDGHLHRSEGWNFSVSFKFVLSCLGRCLTCGMDQPNTTGQKNWPLFHLCFELLLCFSRVSVRQERKVERAGPTKH